MFDWLSDITPGLAAQEMWRRGDYNQPVHFCLKCPDTDTFFIAAGAGLLADHVRKFRFSPEVIQRFGQITDDRGRCLFEESFLNYLQRLRLRVQVWAPAEGTLLLPGAPMLIARGPKAQLILLETAFRYLVLYSTNVCTKAAHLRWDSGDLFEEETPDTPKWTTDPHGWAVRANYIGGGNAALPKHPAPKPIEMEFSDPGAQGEVVQIRRLFQSADPLADVLLDQDLELRASVSKHDVAFRDKAGNRHEMRISRFQNLYLPVLVKGHPVVAKQGLAYLRQRARTQVEHFHETGLENYVMGWLE